MNFSKSILGLVVGLALTGCSAARLPAKAIALNQSGAAAIAAGDLATAESRIALALEYNDRFVEAWTNLGVIELRRGNFARARKHFERAIAINPDLPAAHNGLGNIEDALKHTKDAERHFVAALKVDPGFVPARINLGRQLFIQKRNDEAQEQFLRATQVSPETFAGWSGLVHCLWELNRDSEALAVIENARRRFGTNSFDLEFLYAAGLESIGDRAGAEAHLRSLAEGIDLTNRAAALGMLALLRFHSSDIVEARRLATEALALDETQSVAIVAMAAILQQAGDPTAAAWKQRASEVSMLPSVVAE